MPHLCNQNSHKFFFFLDKIKRKITAVRNPMTQFLNFLVHNLNAGRVSLAYHSPI